MKDWRWLFGAVALAANWPYTLFAVMPTNNQLKAINSASAGSTSRTLVEKWGRLHAVRSALGFAATLIFLLGVDELNPSRFLRRTVRRRGGF